MMYEGVTYNGIDLDSVVQAFKENKPKTKKDVEALGFTLTFKGKGLYRTAYKLDGFPLVIKIPHGGNAQEIKDGIQHSKAEVTTVRSIRKLKKHRSLSSLMPDIFYFDGKSGMLLVRYYKHITKPHRSAIVKLVRTIVNLTWPESALRCDVHGSNIGIGDDDNIVLIDLGYFIESGRL